MEEEEAMTPRSVKEEYEPTDEEVQEHMAARAPFRSWCPFRAKGKAGSAPHFRRDGEDPTVPVISMEYAS